MHTNDLRHVVALEPPKTDGVIACGPLTHQPMTQPYRVVLVALEDQFVVWDQFFDLETDVPTVDTLEDYDTGDYANGDYFRADQLDQATARFAERLATCAEYVKSIYRMVSVTAQENT